jgi:2-polyprenyl-3-methyl-5-hydroxy-6-metoxy-1,4-benzoquinol methylase
MSDTISATATSNHLDYYLEHGLNPVRYEMADLQRHLDRRASLYRILGLPGRLFRNARVLEVAPGSGQNSLHIARLEPGELILVEPNPVAQRDIKQLYDSPGIAPVRPRLIESTLQDFHSQNWFDVVICENWLGHAPAERQLLRKLGTLVAEGGMLVVTAIAPVGILPNVLRKALTCRLDRPTADFTERTALLTEAFGPHLQTIPAMTRTSTDWVHDNVMNPAYFGILLTIPMILDDLGAEFEVFGSSPRFATDWRWFKSLWGQDREFNRHFLEEYQASLHNFLDYRRNLGRRDPARNQLLDGAAWNLIRTVAALEQAVSQRGESVERLRREVEVGVKVLEENIRDLSEEVTAALAEFGELFRRDTLTAEQVAGMRWFKGLFGRETLYLSLEKTG